MGIKNPSYLVRSSWEGTVLNEHATAYLDVAEREYDERVSWYLNLPDSALAQGTVIQLIHTPDSTVLAEHVCE